MPLQSRIEPFVYVINMHECGLLFTENILMTEALYEYSGEVLLAKYLIFHVFLIGINSICLQLIAIRIIPKPSNTELAGSL